MDKNKMRKNRYTKMNTGKGRKINILESIYLKINGFLDGRKGLPRQTDQGTWYSAFMDREGNSFHEFCSHIWGTLQIENEEKYARLEELMGVICHTEELLKAEMDHLSAAVKMEKGFEAARVRGEEKMSDDQVRARRRAESENRLAPAKARVAALEQALREATEEFSALHSRLAEDNNTTRLICHRVKDHTLARVDIYWNTAIKNHAKGTSMPVVPGLALKDEAEDEYLRPHRELMKRAAAIHDAIQDEAVEKEVA